MLRAIVAVVFGGTLLALASASAAFLEVDGGTIQAFTLEADIDTTPAACADLGLVYPPSRTHVMTAADKGKFFVPPHESLGWLIIGTAGDDHIKGGDGNDCIEGGGGDDHIQGQKGDDVLLGGDGDDHIQGGGGADRMFGGAGNDHIQGNNANDLLDGGSGYDKCQGNGGADTYARCEDVPGGGSLTTQGAIVAPSGGVSGRMSAAGSVELPGASRLTGVTPTPTPAAEGAPEDVPGDVPPPSATPEPTAETPRAERRAESEVAPTQTATPTSAAATPTQTATPAQTGEATPIPTQQPPAQRRHQATPAPTQQVTGGAGQAPSRTPVPAPAASGPVLTVK